MYNFGKSLKQHRIDTNVTQKSMAKFLDITEQAYQNYEYGMRIPRLDVLIKLADFFNISLDELVGRKFPK